MKSTPSVDGKRIGRPPIGPVVRFFTRVKVLESGCWEWQGSVKPSTGYGSFSADGECSPHRWIYKKVIGPLKRGRSWSIDHLCRNRICVNPQHLEQVTRKENILRGEGITAEHARKTHCKRGHEFSGDNLRIIESDQGSWIRKERRCRTCDRTR